jgi:hypothetical protein
MRRFLDPEAAGSEEEEPSGSGDGLGPGERRKRKPNVFGERIDEIVLESGVDAIALVHGSKVPLLYRALERAEDGNTRSIREAAVRLCCDPGGLLTLDADGRLYGMTPGKGILWLEAGHVRSNTIRVEVVSANAVDITPPDEPLLQGQRVKLPILFRTDEGPRDDLLVEANVDEPGMGLIGRGGRFTAGLREGQATVRVRFGPAPAQQTAAAIQIGPERVRITGQGGGSDIPEILLCGEEAPGMEEYPPSQRTHAGGEEQPTIIEEPQFRNVVWINPSSKEAMRVRGSRGGPSGVGGIATATFMHFVALKCFDILKRLYVRQQIRDRTVSETEFVQLSALAEVDCANFIDAAWELSDALVRVGGADG